MDKLFRHASFHILSKKDLRWNTATTAEVEVMIRTLINTYATELILSLKSFHIVNTKQSTLFFSLLNIACLSIG